MLVGVRLAQLVATSAAVAATRSRTAKTAAIAALLTGADTDLGLAARYLAGQTRQERIDVGWALLGEIDVAPAAVGGLELHTVDGVLQELSETAGPGSRARRRALLQDLFAAATADEQRFLRALVLGELRQGALAGLMAQGIAAATGRTESAVRWALLLGGDLGEVAEAARDDTLDAFRLTPFRPLQPMLAGTAADVEAAVGGAGGAGRRVRVEWKLDGTRIQVHRRGDEVRVYSRILRDVTARSRAVVEVVAALDVTSVVLDGELLVVDESGRPVAFQDTMRGLGDRAGSGGARPEPFLFDCLHRDGVDLLDEPLARRREALVATVPERHVMPGADVDDVAAAQAVWVDALAHGHEGVVVKDLDSAYEAGRRGGAWRKVKPVRTLDLVVLAVEWGSGRRRGWLSNLHLGARDPATGGFVMLGKTFKGMTDELLAWQTARFLALETGRDGHVVHVRPEQVVEIAVDGVQRSTRYPGGLALRFARVLRYRDDKTPADADTLDTVRALQHPDGSPPS